VGAPARARGGGGPPPGRRRRRESPGGGARGDRREGSSPAGQDTAGDEGEGGYFGCGVRRRYGLSARQPPGNLPFASSSLTAGTMMTSSPCFQFTGVATLCLSVSCRESMTRRISSKLRPVVCGYVIISR